jgi:pimeloyl-ACP methyl ester carboxylesterase
VIRELFALDDSAVAHQIATRMAESRFLERLLDESYEIVDGRFAGLRQAATASHFSDVEGRFRKEFAAFLPDFEEDEEGVRQTISDDKALKIINRMFDAFAPRMFLIGHSQGGLVALRAMQLGMRRVRVKDARRFLYSPRSGRVHRFSPVAMAIGLGAPFNGIDRSPDDLGPRGGDRLTQDSLPAWVKTLMPGVGQMLHGSAFLKKLRGAFIPFDCSAMSIGNPEDGFVPLDGTRLPVGDFKNMHNLAVASTAPFDVVDIAPRIARPAFSFWPLAELRKRLNEDAQFDGIRQHCSFLVDLGENWDVDKGEIVQEIFTNDDGERLFEEMMYEVNFDGLREQLMANLLYRLRGATPEERKHLAWMAPRLRHMIREEALPFYNSLDKRAALALNYIETQ